MFKFALAVGIVLQWLTGPTVESALGFAFALTRTAMLTLAAWMALEAARALLRVIDTLDDRA